MKFRYCLAGLLVAACGSKDKADAPVLNSNADLIIIGVDGMDPVLAKKYMDAGKLPNFKKLADKGTFMPLGTTDPPQSPVAWSAFMTGLDLGGHGIFDFVHRNPESMEPYLSTSKTTSSSSFLGLKKTVDVDLLRGGEAFWQLLEKDKVPATTYKIPANYPPAESLSNASSTGMGTPDLLGTPGTFQVWSNSEGLKSTYSGGIGHKIKFVENNAVEMFESEGEDGKTQTTEDKPILSGPTEINATFEITRDLKNKSALIQIDGNKVILSEKKWTEWLPVKFGATPVSAGVPGMVRLHLRSVEPFHLYATPVNIDPSDPYLPVSEPPDFAEDLAKEIGRYYTQGMAEDSKALTHGILTDDEYLEQSDLVFQERIAMLKAAMKAHDKGGAFFYYFSTIDQVSHMFYGSLVETSLPKYKKYDWVVPSLYEKMDVVMGDILEWAGDRPVVVMSDHGFAPYKYKVHLNTWLAQMGYLSVLPSDKVVAGKTLGHIDWENTQAYALGLNQLFVNFEGREANGVVAQGERDQVIRNIKRDLSNWYYEGEKVVTEAVEPDPGDYPSRAPDLIIGYNRGYRSSDPSALGQVGNEVVTVNEDHWNGDHCMASRHVPGVLFSTIPMAVDKASLVDFAPSILAFFGKEGPKDMVGNVMWQLPKK